MYNIAIFYKGFVDGIVCAFASKKTSRQNLWHTRLPYHVKPHFLCSNHYKFFVLVDSSIYLFQSGENGATSSGTTNAGSGGKGRN
jgi:hypothetical protein